MFKSARTDIFGSGGMLEVFVAVFVAVVVVIFVVVIFVSVFVVVLFVVVLFIVVALPGAGLTLCVDSSVLPRRVYAGARPFTNSCTPPARTRLIIKC